MNLTLLQAYKFAVKAHEGQLYGNHPYFFHLLDTFIIAQKFNLSKEVQTACFLHDVLEDTSTHPDEILEEFGPRVLYLVKSVTNEEGSNRKERNLKTYQKIKLDEESIQLKLCDRIANVSGDGSKNEMYKKEHPIFVQELYCESLTGKTKEMFTHLNEILEYEP